VTKVLPRKQTFLQKDFQEEKMVCFRESRHPREGGDPAYLPAKRTKFRKYGRLCRQICWIPACAGMTPDTEKKLLSPSKTAISNETFGKMGSCPVWIFTSAQ
jgi:hypothetical protein